MAEHDFDEGKRKQSFVRLVGNPLDDEAAELARIAGTKNHGFPLDVAYARFFKKNQRRLKVRMERAVGAED